MTFERFKVHLGTVAVEEEAEKTLGGAVGISKLGSWKRTSSERCDLMLPLPPPPAGGRGGFFRELCFLRADPALNSKTL